MGQIYDETVNEEEFEIDWVVTLAGCRQHIFPPEYRNEYVSMREIIVLMQRDVCSII